MMAKNNTNSYNESMYSDYINQKLVFNLFGDKRIVATVKEVRRYELLIERKVKYKSGERGEIQTLLPKSAIIYADII